MCVSVSLCVCVSMCVCFVHVMCVARFRYVLVSLCLSRVEPGDIRGVKVTTKELGTKEKRVLVDVNHSDPLTVTSDEELLYPPEGREAAKIKVKSLHRVCEDSTGLVHLSFYSGYS